MADTNDKSKPGSIYRALTGSTSTVNKMLQKAVEADKLTESEAAQFQDILTKTVKELLRDKLIEVVAPTKVIQVKDGDGGAQYRNLSLIGGKETLEFTGLRLGARDGVLLQFELRGGAGLDDGIVVEIPSRVLLNDTSFCVAGQPVEILFKAKFADSDLKQAMTNLKMEAERVASERKREEIRERVETYGGGFGSWG